MRILPIAALVLLCFVVTHASADAQTPPPRSADSAILWRATIDGAPNGLAVDEETGRIYVAAWTGEQVAVVDPDGTISAIIDTPATDNPQWGPEAIAFDPQTKRVFSVETNGDVTIIDATTNTVIRKQKVWSMGDGAAWPMSADMVIDRGGRRVVSTMRFGPKKVVSLDADSLGVAGTFPDVQGDVLGLAVNEKTHMAYVGNPPQAFITGIDLINNKVFPVVSGLVDGPSNLVADSRTNLLYAAAGSAGFLYVVDTKNNKLVDTIDVPRPGSQFSNFLALNAASDRLYYSSGTGLVSVNIKTNEVRSIQAFGGTARGLAYDSARQRLYILDDTGMTAVDAQQIESSPSPGQLPGAGGLPADTGANQWILLGGLLAAIGCLFLWRSFSRRPDQHP